MKLTVEVAARDGAARTGHGDHPPGGFEVPTFMPVGTRGTIRALTHPRAGRAAGRGRFEGAR